MAKRGKIQLSGANPIFRISKPGVDVDSAGENDFLLHEDHLYSQPFWWQFIACPFSGYEGVEVRDQTVNRTIPNTGSVPMSIIYPVGSNGTIIFPFPKSEAAGSSANGFPGLERWYIWHSVTRTQLSVRFLKNDNSRRSPQGCYVMLMRLPSV
ncbi:hypothetical protein [Aquamicrobium sp. LC103]|uniref:hypothetical protein n=1 Tax=Aquamicrobium sp. LC103 TaxID=1120658 RepID=UPI00063EB39E|nr:hypothetical protein [Aquamicrobium sp. LC103]TKT79961.1 hypothetical protein XW59_006255 [Aquamicrobium sp. LC103]